MRVAVAGGTGLVGRHVVEELTAAGHHPVVLARSTGVDLVTGTGLDGALAGVDAVVDVTNVTTTSGKKAVAFFDRVAHTLQDAGEQAGVRHHVLLSIVGIDRVGLGYYQENCTRKACSRAGGRRGRCCAPPSSTSSPSRPRPRPWTTRGGTPDADPARRRP